MILCFHDGFCLSFMYWEKSYRVLFFWEYFYGHVFTGFVFGESHLHSRGSFNLLMLWAFRGLYWIGIAIFCFLFIFREDTICSFLFSFWFGGSGKKWVDFWYSLGSDSSQKHCDWSWILLRSSTFFCHNTILFCSQLQLLFSLLPSFDPSLHACTHHHRHCQPLPLVLLIYAMLCTLT